MKCLYAVIWLVAAQPGLRKERNPKSKGDKEIVPRKGTIKLANVAMV